MVVHSVEYDENTPEGPATPFYPLSFVSSSFLPRSLRGSVAVPSGQIQSSPGVQIRRLKVMLYRTAVSH